MQGGLLLNVVVAEGSVVLQSFPCKDESLRIGRDSFLVLDLSLDHLNGIGVFCREGDSLSCQGSHEYLHVSS